MENSINKQFKMNPGSKEVDTPGTFKIDKAMTGLNMGHPMNYGMADSPANVGHKKDKKKKIGTEGMSVQEKLDYYAKQKKKSKGKKASKVKMGIGTGYSSL